MGLPRAVGAEDRADWRVGQALAHGHAGNRQGLGHVRSGITAFREVNVGRAILLMLLGVPLPIILLLALVWR